jgi:cytochrome P450
MTSEVDGHRLTRENILDILYLLMIAGLDTVASSFSCIIAWLAQHPEERRELTADRTRWALALEELMRFESPVFVGTRLATKDVEINGRAFTAGTTFIVSWAAANLDPAAFEDAQTVKLDRSPNKHIAFASGMHRCLGSHLARLELRTALQRLHERIPDYRIDPDDEMVYETVGVRGAKRLPIVWD